MVSVCLIYFVTFNPLIWLLGSPPPTTDFWRNGRYKVNLPDGRHKTILVALEPKQIDSGIQSPIRSEVWYPEELVSAIDLFILISSQNVTDVQSPDFAHPGDADRCSGR